MFNRLLHIKKIRERNARLEEQKRAAILAQRREQLENALDAQKNYHLWRVQEEKRRFDEIMGTALPLPELENLNHIVAGLRRRETDFDEDVIRCEQHRDEAVENLKIAGLARQKAQKAVDKYEHLTDREQRHRHQREQRREDAELEEFMSKTALVP